MSSYLLVCGPPKSGKKTVVRQLNPNAKLESKKLYSQSNWEISTKYYTADISLIVTSDPYYFEQNKSSFPDFQGVVLVVDLTKSQDSILSLLQYWNALLKPIINMNIDSFIIGNYTCDTLPKYKNNKLVSYESQTKFHSTLKIWGLDNGGYEFIPNIYDPTHSSNNNSSEDDEKINHYKYNINFNKLLSLDYATERDFGSKRLYDGLSCVTWTNMKRKAPPKFNKSSFNKNTKKSLNFNTNNLSLFSKLDIKKQNNSNNNIKSTTQQPKIEEKKENKQDSNEKDEEKEEEIKTDDTKIINTKNNNSFMDEDEEINNSSSDNNNNITSNPNIKEWLYNTDSESENEKKKESLKNNKNKKSKNKSKKDKYSGNLKDRELSKDIERGIQSMESLINEMKATRQASKSGKLSMEERRTRAAETAMKLYSFLGLDKDENNEENNSDINDENNINFDILANQLFNNNKE